MKFNYKSPHFLSSLIFLAFSILSSYLFLVGNTLFLYRDLVWPSNPDAMLTNAVSALDLESMRRIIYLGPFFTLTGILGLSSLAAEKIFFVAIFFGIAFSAYYTSFKFLRAKTNATTRSIVLISILAGFFYLYNPYATQKVVLMAYGFAFSYAMIPLIFYFFDKALNKRGFKNILLASIFITLAIAGTSQFLVYLPLFLLVPWFGITIARRYVRGDKITYTIKNFLYVIGLSAIISMYWVLPTFFISTERLPSPSYILTDLMLRNFSGDTTLLNGFRLLGVWWPYIELTPIVDQTFWRVLTFVIPVMIFTSILLAKRTELKFYSISFLLLALLVLFFYKGFRPPFGEFYLNLYSIPVVGWMFRVPDANGIFLPFFFMMIIVLMGHSLSGQLRKGLLRFLRFIPPVILVSSIALISWPMFTGDFGGIYKDNRPYVGPTTPIPDAASLLETPERNVVVVGGSSIVASVIDPELHMILSDSSITYTNRHMGNLQQTLHAASIVITDERNDLILQFIGDETTLVKPFDATFTHDTTGQKWSIASTSNPLHGPFTTYVNQHGLRSTDFDYGLGLVFTWGKDKLPMSFDIQESGDYELFVRYMQNPKGGNMNIVLDGKLMEINTEAPSTKFVWKSLGTSHLTKGSHLLELENVHGFNVVNVFAIIPTDQYPKLIERMHDHFENTRVSFILDGDSFFSPGASIGGDIFFEDYSGGFGKTYNNTLTTPPTATHISIEIWARNDLDGQSSYRINNIQIYPSGDSSNRMTNAEIFDKFYNLHPLLQTMEKSRDNVRVSLGDDNSVWRVIKTKPIPIIPNTQYDYAITIDSDNAWLYSLISYSKKNTEVLTNKVVNMDPQAELLTEIDLPKDSLYTIAARMETCEGCFVDSVLKAGNSQKQVSLYGDKKDFKWFYFTTPLHAGTTTFGIKTHGHTSVDQIVIYSDSYDGERVVDLFSVGTTKPVIIEIKQFDRANYEIRAVAQEPFILKLDQAYSPLWTAYANGIQFGSVPIDNSRNGFYITEMGNLTIRIEYIAHKWFLVGITVTIISIIVSVGYLTLLHLKFKGRGIIVR